MSTQGIATTSRLSQFPVPPFLLDPDAPVPLCAADDVNADWWFPTGHPACAKWAIAICNECPLQASCARYAQDNAVAGIWGGVGVTERTGQVRAEGKPYNPHGQATIDIVVPVDTKAARSKRQQRARKKGAA